jgi:arginine decarboxylase
MTGAIPVFLTPTRNHLGIIGPIPLEEFAPENIEKKIEANPFARVAKNKKPRILTLTQSTYDGVAYNVEMLKQILNGSIDTLHFDEAWLPHAAFHDFYKDMHAIGKDRPRSKDGPHLRDAFDAQAAGGHLAGLADHRAGVREPEARPAHLQRGVPDAHVDVAAVRDHRRPATCRRR